MLLAGSKPGERVAIPKPLELPRPDIQDPYKLEILSEPIKGVKSNVNTINAIGAGLQNLAGLDFGAILILKIPVACLIL